MIRLPKWLLVVLALTMLVGLAVPVLAADEEAKGKIKDVSADKNTFVLTDKDGKDLTFHMRDDAKIRLNDQDKKLADLKEGDEVTVTFEKKDNKLMATQIRCERK